MIEQRGTGITTAQIRSAPHRGIFVWCNDGLDYPKRLAVKLGRPDLEIVGPAAIASGWLRGRPLNGLVIDHATKLTQPLQDQLDWLRCNVRQEKAEQQS